MTDLVRSYAPNPRTATPVGSLPLVDDGPTMGQQPTDSLFANDDENLENMTARYHFLCVVVI